MRFFALLFIFVFAAVAAAHAPDFCIKNAVFEGNSVKPYSTTTTYFYQGTVFDFPDGSQEIALFNPGSQHFVLANPEKKVATVLPFALIEKAYLKNSSEGLKSPGELSRFAANPKFDTTASKKEHVVLSSKILTYQAKMNLNVKPEQAAAYANFCDWNAKMDRTVRPASLPADARLELNAAMLATGGIPSEIVLSIGEDKEAHLVKSQHTFVNELSEKDLQRIKAAQTTLDECKQVPLEKYLRNQK